MGSLLSRIPMKMTLEGRSVRPGTVSFKHNIHLLYPAFFGTPESNVSHPTKMKSTHTHTHPAERREDSVITYRRYPAETWEEGASQTDRTVQKQFILSLSLLSSMKSSAKTSAVIFNTCIIVFLP